MAMVWLQIKTGDGEDMNFEQRCWHMLDLMGTVLMLAHDSACCYTSIGIQPDLSSRDNQSFWRLDTWLGCKIH